MAGERWFQAIWNRSDDRAGERGGARAVHHDMVGTVVVGIFELQHDITGTTAFEAFEWQWLDG